MNRELSLSIIARAPSACAAEEITAFEQLVVAGGEVNVETLPGLLSRALSLAFASLGERLVAVGAIKRPHEDYRIGVFEKAGASQNATQFKFELGWVYVEPSFRRRGLACALVKTLVHSLNGVPAYATSREDNKQMHALLKRFGFKPIGASYPSQLNEPQIQLFVRE